jgi:hypothetical protein
MKASPMNIEQNILALDNPKRPCCVDVVAKALVCRRLRIKHCVWQYNATI